VRCGGRIDCNTERPRGQALDSLFGTFRNMATATVRFTAWPLAARVNSAPGASRCQRFSRRAPRRRVGWTREHGVGPRLAWSSTTRMRETSKAWFEEPPKLLTRSGWRSKHVSASDTCQQTRVSQ
jgi:hypothetical protein